jgi:hypothetical protein
VWWFIGILAWLVIVKFILKFLGICASQRDAGDNAANKYFERRNDDNAN